jgi:Protein of unknown function (DUF4235)
MGQADLMAKDQGDWATDAAIVVAGVVAAMVARRLVNVVWVATSGRPVPDDPADPRVSTGEAVTFAVATGALVGVARLLVQRKANALKAQRASVAA